MKKFKIKPLSLSPLQKPVTRPLLLLHLSLLFMSACASPRPAQCPVLKPPAPALMQPPTYRQQWDQLVTSDPTLTTSSTKPTPK